MSSHNTYSKSFNLDLDLFLSQLAKKKWIKFVLHRFFAHVWTNDNLLKNCVEIYQFLQKMRQYWSVYITRTEHRV